MYKELKDAGLTDGEAKVYIAILELGSSTTGPIIEKSGIARSFIYNILDKLLEKGLISYVQQDGKKFYQAPDPDRILDYIEKQKQTLDESKDKIKKILPGLLALRKYDPPTEIQVFEGYRGLQTAFEQYHERCKKGDKICMLGGFPYQEEKYHEYWKEDHQKRDKEGITSLMLFNKSTDNNILKNRNSYKLAEARHMNSDVKTPAWILVYKDVSQIYLQDQKKPFVVEIINKQIAETFKAYFEDYWKKAKKFKK